MQITKAVKPRLCQKLIEFGRMKREIDCFGH
jgi:hypothetical protein